MLLQKHWFYLKEGFLSLSALDIFRGGAGAGSVLCAVGLPGLYSLDPVAPTTPFTLELWQPTCFQTAPCPAGEQNKSASVEDHCYIKHLEAWFSCLAPSPKLYYKCSGGGVGYRALVFWVVLQHHQGWEPPVKMIFWIWSCPPFICGSYFSMPFELSLYLKHGLSHT